MTSTEKQTMITQIKRLMLMPDKWLQGVQSLSTLPIYLLFKAKYCT